MRLSLKQKEAITRIRTKGGATNNIHGLLGYNNVLVDGRVINALMKKGILHYYGHSMNDKAGLYSLTDLGKTFKL